MNEIACQFKCQDQELIAICHPAHKDTGILIVTGGPQYRIGSHRQFVIIARTLAENGFPVFRFDYRDMGDSETIDNQSEESQSINFEHISTDIELAINEFSKQQTHLKKIILLGLCDGASAILIALSKNLTSNIKLAISGLILINPWVYQENTTAKTYLKYYYFKRLAESDFWFRLFKFKINVVHTFKSIISKYKMAFLNHSNNRHASYIDNMLVGLLNFKGKVLTLLSEDDLTAQEFALLLKEHKTWAKQFELSGNKIVKIADADHTFSTKKDREKVIHV
ncbi:MAG: hydrolase 1, exosortase A system-associated, partial [Gammaproteobacteria bacterium]|nr:hydrolase 1, exosortase A system-associated [Gammaproteobacteria bacterium]